VESALHELQVRITSYLPSLVDKAEV